MACYAALLSLFQTLDHINNHPRPPISLDQKQLQSLNQNLTFLLDYLERYSSQEDEDLESRISAAAYAAEDVIETHIVDQIHHAGSNISPLDLSQGIERVILDMDMIKKEVMEVIIKEKINGSQHHHLHTNSSVFTDSASRGQSSTTARFDDVLIERVLDKLTGQQRGLQIIPIVGMGGIGKTTLAKHIYSNPLIVQHFDILAWVTISQEYNRGSILQTLYQEINGSCNNGLSEDKIGEIVYKILWGRRYLIVMDDIWSVEAWDKVKCFFPNNDENNRIMITTRLSNLAFELSGSHDFRMQFLDEDKSWDLICKIVFDKLDCPIELEDIGKKIARNCRGLPLSIAVIGGLLIKSNMTRVYWEYCLHHLNSLINLEDNEYCLQILRTSYKELPIHLKPCFLYMGVFPEDLEINVSWLIKLWVSEGILKPNEDKSLEEVAKECLNELVERNLILVHKLRWNGEAKICKIHDLLRDVCSREAERQKFLCLIWQQEHHTSQDIIMERRICINHEKEGEEFDPEFLHAVESASLTRSLLYNMWGDMNEDSPSLRLGLLRVYSSVDKNHEIVTCSDNAIFEHANLRYLSLNLDAESILPSFCSLLWNLQTLEIGSPFREGAGMGPSEIWEMPLLRHVMLYKLMLPDPPHGEDNSVLENLQTLSIMNLIFSEEVIKRIPNIKKLEVKYEISDDDDDEEELSTIGLNNLCRLQKLESLKFKVDSDCNYGRANVLSNMVSFPHSLKKLTLHGTGLSWDDLKIKIGSLPLLQLLGLHYDACRGSKWETVEGQFCSLRVLDISFCDLEFWDTDDAHFPRLEHLHLYCIDMLEEIPSSIGDIPTLKSIRLKMCTKSAGDSANRIKEVQEENGNEELQVIVATVEGGEERVWGEEDEEYCSHEEDEEDCSQEEDEQGSVGHRIVKRSWQRQNSFP